VVQSEKANHEGTKVTKEKEGRRGLMSLHGASKISRRLPLRVLRASA
jgi:hypothetical protein